MTILGIDPGTATTGYGIINVDNKEAVEISGVRLQGTKSAIAEGIVSRSRNCIGMISLKQPKAF